MEENRTRGKRKRIIKKVILAIRPPYEYESEEEYKNIPVSKRIRAYIVLDSFKENYLVARLKYLEREDEINFALFKSHYPNLTYASLPDGSVYLIPKRNLVRIVSEKLSSEDFQKVSLFLSSRGINDYDTKVAFSKFAKKYFKWRVRVGDVVTMINENNSYSVYYVKEKLEYDFLGVVLHYYGENGLTVTDEEIYIPYDSRYDFIAYTPQFREYVESLINKHSLKLTEGK